MIDYTLENIENELMPSSDTVGAVPLPSEYDNSCPVVNWWSGRYIDLVGMAISVNAKPADVMVIVLLILKTWLKQILVEQTFLN